MKNTEESQIKGELQLVSMDKMKNFISEKLDGFEKIDVRKTKLLKICEKTSEMSQKNEKLDNLVDQKEQNSQDNCILIYGIVEKNAENTDDIVVKTTNEKLYVLIKENEIDRSRRFVKKKGRQKPRPIIFNLTKYKIRIKSFCK